MQKERFPVLIVDINSIYTRAIVLRMASIVAMTTFHILVMCSDLDLQMIYKIYKSNIDSNITHWQVLI